MDASRADKAALKAHLQRLLDCSQCDAEAMWVDMAGAGKVATDTPEQAGWRVNFTLRRTVQEYRSRAQSPPPVPPLPASWTGEAAGEAEEAEDAEEAEEAEEAAVPVCAVCGGASLEHAALQTRRADEGPSLFFRCKNKTCASYNEIVRPVYPK